MPHMKATLANRLNQDLKKIQPNEIRAFDMQVSQIPDIIKLTLGEPDFDTPEEVKNNAKLIYQHLKVRYKAMFPSLLQKMIDIYNKNRPNNISCS